MLQEVDDGAPRSREMNLGRELARALGYEHYAIGHNVTLRKGRYGNATLSRWPILRERNIDLTIGVRKRRGCQHTLIAVETSAGKLRRFEVFNLHLGPSAAMRSAASWAAARWASSTRLWTRPSAGGSPSRPSGSPSRSPPPSGPPSSSASSARPARRPRSSIPASWSCTTWDATRPRG